MRFLFISLIMLVTAFSFACGRPAQEVPPEVPTLAPVTAATPLAKLELKRDAALEAEIARIAEAAKGKVGVAAVAIDSGDAALVNADGHYPMQSVYKLPIAMAVVEQAMLGKLNLDTNVRVTKDDMVREGMRSPLRDMAPDGGEYSLRDLIRFALVESDGTASDVLMRAAGGAGEVQAYLTQLGIADIKVVNTEKELGGDWQSQYANYAAPSAAVELLRFIDPCLNAALDDPKTCRIPGPPVARRASAMLDEKLIFTSMAESNPGARRLKGMLPKGTVVAHKTGTGGTQNGITGATNDIGIVTLPNGKHFAIAVFVSDSPADEATREAVIARIAKAVWDRWAKK